jgi:PPOX class probable F420-dependent enzyme
VCEQFPPVAGGRSLELLSVGFSHVRRLSGSAAGKSDRTRFPDGRPRVSTGMTTSHNDVPAGAAPAYADPLTAGLPAPRALQAARQILGGPHLSVLATTNADGSAQMSVILVKPDGDDILFSTIEGRRKTKNMARDPRVTLLLHSLAAAATDSAYATVYGTVEFADDPGGAFHQVMYDLHLGGATPPPEPGAHRLIVRIHPHRAYAALPFAAE